ncbi:thioredoxin-like domain-containing protein [Olivibacter sp. CPCC 100613]|uniref:TlpA family protein disulfide reductase n=1 Tax=Olivibacter sp. CPCC 100613 TaxID=3079931 RepID=UPI002FF8D947
MKNHIINSDHILLLAFLSLTFVLPCRADEDTRFLLKGAVKSTLIDTLVLHVWNDIVTYDLIYDELHRTYTIPLHKGAFEITIDSIADVSIISLSSGRLNGLPVTLLDQYYICAGDRISIDINQESLDSRLKIDDNGKPIGKYRLSFAGKGSEKFNCRYQLDSFHEVLQHQPLALPPRYVSKWTSDSVYFQKAERITRAETDFLEAYKDIIEPGVYRTMRADIIGRNAYVFILKKLFLAARTDSDSPMELEKIKTFVSQSELLHRMNLESQHEVYHSAVFTQALVYQARVEEQLYADMRLAYERLALIKHPRARERALTNYLVHHYVRMPSIEAGKRLNDALLYITDTNYVNLVNKLRLTDRGQPIPSFALYDADDTEIDLRSFIGKVVFVDFFYTGCGNCASYFKKTVSKAEEYFKDNRNVVFVTISIDGNKEKWINSVKSGIYTSAHAVNLYTGGVGERHPIISHFNVSGYPKPLLISGDGSILSTDFHALGRTEPDRLIKTIEEALRSIK